VSEGTPRGLRGLLAPLRGVPGQALVSVLGGLALLTLYLYGGHHRVFVARFGHLVADSRYAAWAAHGYQFASACVLLLAIPLLWLRMTGKRLADAGLAVGDWRAGLGLFAVGALLLAAPLYLGAGSPEMQAEYPLVQAAGRSVRLFLLWELTYLSYYIAWEFFFRGFWGLALVEELGAFGALALQTAASTLMHIGKPAAETAAAIVGGVGFGLIALRSRSVLYVILLHWTVGMLTDLFCLLRAA
jgi:membrane protease YdiL (CAAX protease family)